MGPAVPGPARAERAPASRAGADAAGVLLRPGGIGQRPGLDRGRDHYGPDVWYPRRAHLPARPRPIRRRAYHGGDLQHPADTGRTHRSLRNGYAPSGTSPGRSGPFGAVRLTCSAWAGTFSAWLMTSPDATAT